MSLDPYSDQDDWVAVAIQDQIPEWARNFALLHSIEVRWSLQDDKQGQLYFALPTKVANRPRTRPRGFFYYAPGSDIGQFAASFEEWRHGKER